MKNKVDIYVFDDFFADCITNAMVSMTLTYDKSYRLAAYMNGYDPHFGPFDDQYFPYIGYTEEYMNAFQRCFEHQALLFQDDDYLGLIRKMVDEGTYLQLGVDLFYWHETGAAYQKEHLSHPSVVVGYDDELSILYVLEDALGSTVTYGICEVPYERVQQALTSKENNFRELTGVDYRTWKIKEEYPSYTFDYEQVKRNAHNILTSLHEDRFTHFSMHGDDFSDRPVHREYIKVHTRYENRCIANRYLINELLKRGHITKLQSETMLDCSRIMQENIGKVKYNLLYQLKTQRKLNLELIEKLWSDVIQTEIKMWSVIV